jgi:TonB family protein
MFNRYLNDEKILSTFGTIFIHIILVILFLLIQIKFSPVIEEFTEVSLAGGFEAPLLERLSESPVETEELQQMDKNIFQRLPEEIDLPERRELMLDEQRILEKVQPDFEKLVTPGNIVKKSPSTLPPLPRSSDIKPTFTRQEKQIEHGLFRKELDEKLLTGTQKVEINVDRNFDIDWEGEIKREIYQRRLPEFPPDVQREATIKIQFSVLPNGMVGSALIIQKGDTKLENLTLEAFKTWRFNPLPDYVDQVQQTGVITFRFKLN